jgi:protein SCO1/2
VVVLFFGYTQCPDVCPTSLNELNAVKKALGPDGERLQVLFATVDPERDTPGVLKAYMASFDPSFLALYTTPDKMDALAKEYKMYYKKVEGPTPTSYTMDHSAGSYVYDTQGKVRLYTRYDVGQPVRLPHPAEAGPVHRSGHAPARRPVSRCAGGSGPVQKGVRPGAIPMR